MRTEVKLLSGEALVATKEVAGLFDSSSSLEAYWNFTRFWEVLATSSDELSSTELSSLFLPVSSANKTELMTALLGATPDSSTSSEVLELGFGMEGATEDNGSAATDAISTGDPMDVGEPLLQGFPEPFVFSMDKLEEERSQEAPALSSTLAEDSEGGVPLVPEEPKLNFNLFNQPIPTHTPDASDEQGEAAVAGAEEESFLAPPPSTLRDTSPGGESSVAETAGASPAAVRRLKLLPKLLMFNEMLVMKTLGKLTATTQDTFNFLYGTLDKTLGVFGGAYATPYPGLAPPHYPGAGPPGGYPQQATRPPMAPYY
eukprot:GHVT01099764.1.p1 GENE.GHVT01099764.1~~GHVT01099764.1.p1  ORF type:complete len:315 (+),score=64.32 GHVT01099764.1:1219-2163(+)